MNIKNARWMDVAENLLAVTVDETEWRGPVADHIYYPALIESGVEIAEYVAPVMGYAARRRAAYAKIADQLDMQFHDGANGTTTWVDHVAEVKAAHPKS